MPVSQRTNMVKQNATKTVYIIHGYIGTPNIFAYTKQPAVNNQSICEFVSARARVYMCVCMNVCVCVHMCVLCAHVYVACRTHICPRIM